MKKHQAKINELIDQYATFLRTECRKLISSGMIDVDAYQDDDYRLAKIILTAAIKRTQDDFRMEDRVFFDEFTNLMNV